MSSDFQWLPSLPLKFRENVVIGKTLLDLLGKLVKFTFAVKELSNCSTRHLVRSNERCNASSAIQQQRRGSRSKGSDIESGSEASSGRENNQSQATRTAMRSLHEDDSSDDDNDNDNVLRFDTSSGELIRPVRRKVPSASNGALEPGQSEEEDDYVPTLADAPRPSTSLLPRNTADD